MATPGTTSARPLTPKQARFVAEYLIDLNGAQAAIRAGYSEKAAKEQAAENLTKPNIVAAVQEAMAARSKKTDITSDWVLKRLKENVDRAMQAIPVLDNQGNETGEYRYEGQVANTALNLIGKHLGMFVEQVEVKQKTELVIVEEIVDAASPPDHPPAPGPI